jgi:hypothetical protein
MQDRPDSRVFAVLAIAIVFLIVVAGCTSIPGPEPRSTPAPPTTTVPVTPQVRDPGMRVTTTPVPTTAVTVRTLAMVTPVATREGSYEARTCAQQGGGIAEPGQRCPGTWLVAPDTFNCCSVTPVRDPVRNISITVPPFDAVIPLDDDPGSVLP